MQLSARWEEAGAGLVPGTSVGRYVIARPMATSPSSQLFHVRHRVLGARAVLKVCLYDDGAAAREARALAQLDTPGVPAVLEIGQLSPELGAASYFVMEYVSGERLGRWLHERRRLEPRSAVTMAAQLLSTLEQAHQRGIVHGDVKPDNVLIRRGQGLDEQVVLIDFGIGRLGTVPVSGRHQRITHRYAAPEVLHGHLPTERSDVFGVGVVLYEMLVGEPPIWIERDGALQTADLSRLVPVSEALSLAVQRALEPEPERRYATCREFRRTLLALDARELEGYGGEGSVEAALCREQAHTLQLSPIEESRPSLVTATFCGRTELRSAETPSIWLVMGDPATDDPSIAGVLEALRDRYRVRILSEEEKEEARQEYLRGGSPPWVLVFGELHALTGEPIVTDAGRHGETTRLVISEHPDVTRLSRVLNACGVHEQLCLPSSAARLRSTIERAVERSRSMRRRYDGLRIDAQDLQCDLRQLRTEVGLE